MGATEYICILAGLMCVAGQFVSVPSIPNAFKKEAVKAGAESFLSIWEYTLSVDGIGNGPSLRFNIEPKTILAPSEFAFLRLIPQDIAHPMFVRENSALRSSFLFNHLGLDAVDPADPQINTNKGFRIDTLNDKQAYIKRDDSGNLIVEAEGKIVPVMKVTGLSDGSYIYILESTLFDSQLQIRNTLGITRAANEPLGPPLDLSQFSQSVDNFNPQFRAPPFVKDENGVLHFAPAPPSEDDFLPIGPPRAQVLPGTIGRFGPPGSFNTGSNFGPPAAPVEITIGQPPAIPLPEQDNVIKGPHFAQSGGVWNQDGGLHRSGSNKLSNSRTTLQQFGEGKEFLSSIDQFATLFDLTEKNESSIVTALQDHGLITMLTLLDTSGLLSSLVSGADGPYIILAPSEEAFKHRPSDNLAAMEDMLRYHVIPLKGQPVQQITDGATYKSLSGPRLRFNIYGQQTYVNGAEISQKDIGFPQGTIQKTESVLSPPRGDVRNALLFSMMPLTQIVTLITVSPTIRELGPRETITILAPLDAAINSKGYCWRCLLLEENRGDSILGQHMVRGTWYTAGLVKEGTVTTVAGTTITIRKNHEDVVTVNGIPLLRSNISATNGVVHILADVIPQQDLGHNQNTEISPLSGYLDNPIINNNPGFSTASNVDNSPILNQGNRQHNNFQKSQFSKNLDDLTIGQFIPNHNPFDRVLFNQFNDENDANGSPLITFLKPTQETKDFEPIIDLRSSDDLYIPEDLKNSIVSVNSLFSGDRFLPPIPVESGNIDGIVLDRTDLSTVDMKDDTHLNTELSDIPDHISDFSHLFNSGISDLSSFDIAMPQGMSSPPANLNMFYSPPNIDQDQNRDIKSIFNFQETNNRPNISPKTPVLQGNSNVEMGFKNLLLMKPLEIVDILQESQPSRKAQKLNTDAFLLADEAVVQRATDDLFDHPNPCYPPTTTRRRQSYTPDLLTLLEDLKFTDFADLLRKAGLAETLNSPHGLWTIFAPTNSALKELPIVFLKLAESKPEILRQLLSYHISPGAVNSIQQNTKLPTLSLGHLLSVTCFNDGVNTIWSTGGALIDSIPSSEDEASGVIHAKGVIYAIDRVIYAPRATTVNTLQMSPAVSTFSRIVQQSNEFQQFLNELPQFTIFALTNDAFQNNFNISDPQEMLEWLKSHVVAEVLHKEVLLKRRSVTTVNNVTLSIGMDSSGLLSVNDQVLSYTDVNTSDGVIHVADTFLINKV